MCCHCHLSIDMSLAAFSSRTVKAFWTWLRAGWEGAVRAGHLPSCHSQSKKGLGFFWRGGLVMCRQGGRGAAAARSACCLPEPSCSPCLPNLTWAVAESHGSPRLLSTTSRLPLWMPVLVPIYLLGREWERILSGGLHGGGVQPKGWLGAAAY